MHLEGIVLEHHLQTLVEELHLTETPVQDETGGYQLKLTPDLHITLKALNPGISFYTSLTPFHPTKREELVIHLAKANFLGQGTGGGSIGLDEDEKLLTLSFVLPYDRNYTSFKETLEDFANYADYWRAELARIKHVAEG